MKIALLVAAALIIGTAFAWYVTRDPGPICQVCDGPTAGGTTCAQCMAAIMRADSEPVEYEP